MVRKTEMKNFIKFIAQNIQPLDCSGVCIVRKHFMKGGKEMTIPQIRYREYQEGKRHNVVVEDLNRDSLNETVRTNQANEDIRREANANQRYATDVNAENSWRIANLNAETSRYATDTNRLNAITAANVSRANTIQSTAASRYASDINRENAQLSAATSSANAELQASVTRDSIASNAELRTRELDLSEENQKFQQGINQSKLELEQMMSQVSKAKTEAEMSLITTRVDDIFYQHQMQLKDYYLKAEAQRNSTAMTQASIALTKANEAKATADTAFTYAKTANEFINVLNNVNNYLESLSESILGGN